MMQSSITFLRYFTCITTFARIIPDRVIFAANMTLNKLIIYEIPYDAGNSWNQIRGVHVTDVLIFVHEIPDFFVLSEVNPPHYTNPPLPGIKAFLTSSNRTRTSSICTSSSNIVTSTTRPTTSRGTYQAADESTIRSLLQYDSDESEIDISRY